LIGAGQVNATILLSADASAKLAPLSSFRV
jgi:hypothetical protein